ncbi:MAG: hypothetical protein ABF608_07005 [Sporolactobacillus sp.]
MPDKVTYDENTGVMSIDETDNQFEKAHNEAFALLKKLNEHICGELDKVIPADNTTSYLNEYTNLYATLHDSKLI